MLPKNKHVPDLFPAMKSGNTTIYASLKKRQNAGSGRSPATPEVQKGSSRKPACVVQYEPGDLLWRATIVSSWFHTFNHQDATTQYRKTI